MKIQSTNPKQIITHLAWNNITATVAQADSACHFFLTTNKIPQFFPDFFNSMTLSDFPGQWEPCYDIKLLWLFTLPC